MSSPTLITGTELTSVLDLNLRGIKLDQYVRVRRLGASHKEAVDVVSFDYIRVHDYSKARINSLSHKQIMNLVKQGYDLKYINSCIDEGYALRCAKQAYKSYIFVEDYVFLRKKKVTHAKIMELSQIRKDGEYRKWNRFIARIKQGMSLEAALDFTHELDD